MSLSKSFVATAFGVALGLSALSASGALSAASPAVTNAIAARQANFKRMGAAMKALQDTLRSGAPSKPVMVNAANTIAATARQQGGLFPAGSGPASGVKTDALPGIWTGRAAFDQQMTAMVTEANRLVAAANGGNAAAVDAQYRAVGRTCSNCHKQFRVDN